MNVGTAPWGGEGMVARVLADPLDETSHTV
jgi:hypothetical protein